MTDKKSCQFHYETDFSEYTKLQAERLEEKKSIRKTNTITGRQNELSCTLYKFRRSFIWKGVNAQK